MQLQQHCCYHARSATQPTENQQQMLHTTCPESPNKIHSPCIPAHSVLLQVAAHVGWPPEDGLTSLAGFTGPWQRALCKGRVLQPSDTLQAAGLTDEATVTVVRVELVAEGWKVSHWGVDPEGCSTECLDHHASSICLLPHRLQLLANTAIRATAASLEAMVPMVADSRSAETSR